LINFIRAIILHAVHIHRSNFDWFFTYKLYHLPLWFLYHSLWWTLTLGSFEKLVDSLFFSPYAIKFSFYFVIQTIAVYFNLYFLIPRFLEKGRYSLYAVLLILTIVACASLIIPGYYITAWLSGQSMQSLFGVEPSQYLRIFNTNAFPSTVACMTLGMSLKLTKNWVRARRREQVLEKEKLETELKFLRSQINPHFLFNSINSIFVLIHKNPMMASESLAKFSGLLRYQLYECNEQHIPLGQELTFLENFIALQSLRQDQNHIELSMEIEQRHAGGLMVAPFVLIPFIENAFKHVSQRQDGSNWIKMRLWFDHERLHFEIVNSTSPHFHASSEPVHYSGIGLKNVQRRLDLLYPGGHTLSIAQDADQYHVSLQLTLHERPVHERLAAQV
jgi:sensor histidine kinase YesM